jgi:cytidylate kinase
VIDVIAIDGPAGAGKSTVSRAVARRLGYRHVDSGAMYRVVGVLAHEAGVSSADADALAAICDGAAMRFEERGGEVCVYSGARDLTAAIRTADAGQWASQVSAVPVVRQRLVAEQRRLGAGGRVVMEGRDIGTVVFPDAALKVFLDATPRERAARRAAELRRRGEAVDFEHMVREIEARDARDRGRVHSPLRPAADAVLVDTSGVALDAVIERICALVRARGRP